jgi:hypothetical protein
VSVATRRIRSKPDATKAHRPQYLHDTRLALDQDWIPVLYTGHADDGKLEERFCSTQSLEFPPYLITITGRFGSVINAIIRKDERERSKLTSLFQLLHEHGEGRVVVVLIAPEVVVRVGKGKRHLLVHLLDSGAATWVPVEAVDATVFRPEGHGHGDVPEMVTFARCDLVHPSVCHHMTVQACRIA